MFGKHFVGWEAVAVVASSAFAADVTPAKSDAVTYSSHIATLIQENCEQCHRPSGIAPFSLTNYRQVKGWSKMIKEVVSDGRMPPWFADHSVGKWSNDMSLAAEEKEMLLAWIDKGMPQGNPEQAPASREYPNEWMIGQPDLVFEMPEEVTIEPTGVVPYQHYVLPTKFEEDRWVTAMQLKPGNEKVVHHIIIFVQDPNAPNSEKERALGIGGNFLDVYAPGQLPIIWKDGLARRIPAGASLVWQVHYTPTGKRETDRSKFGIVFAKEPVTQEVRTWTTMNTSFEIPAGDANFRVIAESILPEPAIVHTFTPHMHYRGKSMDYYFIYPDGREEHVCSVPNYDFNWQLDYRVAEPMRLPAGTKVRVVSHYDNSDKNPFNPDPTQSVRWGEQTWEEMMLAGMFISWENQDHVAAPQGKNASSD